MRRGVIEGKAAPLPIDNIDTDQIIPAQFLKITKREGLSRFLFYRWRYDESGKPREGFVLDDPRYSGASILVTGRNFGIGSSREHAVWALLDYGIRGIIAPSFGDIFYENAARNGLACIKLSDDVVRMLFDRASSGDLYIRIDLERRSIEYDDKKIEFEMDEATRRMLLYGLDNIGITVEYYGDAIKSYEDRMGSYIDRISVKRRGSFTQL
jgi:3-isopropylmalate dehydratase small subunit